MNDELVAALRETPTVARHLHVPLQSGDDGVLRAMGRRYTHADVPAPARAAADDFNLTTDVIVGFPARTSARSRTRCAPRRDAGLTKVHVFPYSPRPGTVTADDDPVPPAVKKERSARLRAASHEACVARWRAKIGREDVVLVDRPGPRLRRRLLALARLDAPVGELVRVRAAAVTEEGILAA